MADIALIMAEDYLSNSGSGTIKVNVNAKEEKGHPRSQLTEGILTQIGRGRLKVRCDAVQGVAVPLSTALLEGFFSS